MQITGSFTQEEVETLKTVFSWFVNRYTTRCWNARWSSWARRPSAKPLYDDGVYAWFWWHDGFHKPRLGRCCRVSGNLCGVNFCNPVDFRSDVNCLSAGLVLTVGMAVDANILIFERLREELRQKILMCQRLLMRPLVGPLLRFLMLI